MTVQKQPTKIICIMTDILKERLPSPLNLGRAPVSSEGEGSPIIWPMTLQKSPTKIVWIMTDISKERLPSPQNLGRAACKL